MKASIFQNELAKTSSVFGRKKEVSVVFQGDGAATDGSTIQLPALNMNAEVSEEQAAIMRGYVDHEAGHVRHTDFSVLRDNADELRSNKLLKSCANALEDIWLEQRVRREYPGAEANIKATADAVNREFIENVSPSDERLRDPVWVGPVAATWIGRQSYAPETTKQCIDMLDDELRAEIAALVERVDGCRNSREVFDLAREFEGAMRGRKAAMGPEPKGEPKGAPKPHEVGADEDKFEPESMGEETAYGDTDGDMGDGPRGEDASDEDGSEGPEGSDDGRSDGDGRADDDGEPVSAGGDDVVYEDFDLSKAVESALRKTELVEDSGSAHVYKPFSTAHDKWHHRTDAANKYGRKRGNNLGYHELAQGTAQAYDDVLLGMSGTVNGMRRKLERALIAKQMRDWDVGREAGRLDTRRLTAAMAGRTNVFKTRTERNEIDTAVSVLIDLSGSMNEGLPTKIEIARQTAIALVEAVDRTGIKYEVLGFQNKSRPASDEEWRTILGAGERYSRFEPLDMYVFKQFDERLYEAKGAIGAIVDTAYGNNTDGEAVELAYRRLMARPETRKIMLVLSDGSPVAYGDRQQQQQHLRNVVGEIEGDGRVDIVGIGIKSASVGHFYAKHVVVRDIQDLSGTVMDQLAKLLMGERFAVDNSKLLERRAG